MPLYAKRVTVYATILFIFTVNFGCKRNNESASNGNPATKGEPAPLAPPVDTMREAEALTLFEGLPHQLFEADALKSELSQKRTVQLRDFPFYEETFTLKREEASALITLFTSGDGLRPQPPVPPNVTVVKMCGGFHPDYAIQWTVKGRRYDVLICFGCREARCYSPDRRVDCDLSEDARTKLTSMLAPYWRNRPVTPIPQ